MGRQIVVAVDGDEESRYALEWCLKNVAAAAAVAEEENSKDTLVLLYARPPPAVYPAIDGAGYMFSPDIMATMEQHSKEVAERVVEAAKRICAGFPLVRVEMMVENGDARDVICEVVEKVGADLLVLGSHGYGMIKRAFLGSVSNHCAQHAKCPVLIVKRPKQ